MKKVQKGEGACATCSFKEGIYSFQCRADETQVHYLNFEPHGSTSHLRCKPLLAAPLVALDNLTEESATSVDVENREKAQSCESPDAMTRRLRMMNQGLKLPHGEFAHFDAFCRARGVAEAQQIRVAPHGGGVA